MLHRVERLSNNEQLYDKSVRDDIKVASILGNIKYSLEEIGDYMDDYKKYLYTLSSQREISLHPVPRIFHFHSIEVPIAL